jgi:dihydrofolate synthase / folylpolyglutamate synthase
VTNFLNFSLEEWLHHLEYAHPKEIQLGLTRIRTVAERLGLLDWDIPIITVGGTNGKGSTVAMLEAIYSAAGYKVASYTSPHLLIFNERIRVNNSPISDDQLCSVFSIIEQRRQDIHLTYFEMATLAALWHFKHTPLDVIILEVGLGGRLDATNIIENDLAIITTIDFDHQEQLGNTKEAIGYEKAGILRANTPFIYADSNPPRSIVQQALSLNNTMYCLDDNYSFTIDINGLHISLSGRETLRLPIPKLNPKAAVGASIAVLNLRDKLPITLEQLAIGIKDASIQGRQQIVKGEVTTVFDIAHNPQAVGLLAQFIENYHPKNKIHAVFAGLKDKDLCGLINPMSSLVDYWYPALLSGKRAASETLLRECLITENCAVKTCYNSPLAAYEAAKQAAKCGDLIVVYGSFLTVSAVMTNWMQQEMV